MIKKLFLSFILVTGLSHATTGDEEHRFGPIPVVGKEVFESLGGGRPGGCTLSSGLFRERSTGHVWIGKAPAQVRGDDTVDRESTESAVCREKIASDIYAYYGVTVPETVLSLQPTVHTGIVEYDGQEAMHIMSRLVDGYHDYKTQEGFREFKATLHPRHGAVVCHNDACEVGGCTGSTKAGYFTAHKAEGLGVIAAVATWLHDIDFIGGGATNIGYRLVRRGAQVVAELILVDPGEAFTDPTSAPYPAPRHIRFAIPGADETHTVSFETLCPVESQAYTEFTQTLRRIIETDERTIVRFFTRINAEYFVSRDARSAGGLTQQLMDRKRELSIHYAAELAALPPVAAGAGSGAAAGSIPVSLLVTPPTASGSTMFPTGELSGSDDEDTGITVKYNVDEIINRFYGPEKDMEDRLAREQAKSLIHSKMKGDDIIFVFNVIKKIDEDERVMIIKCTRNLISPNMNAQDVASILTTVEGIDEDERVMVVKYTQDLISPNMNAQDVISILTAVEGIDEDRRMIIISRVKKLTGLTSAEILSNLVLS